MDDRAKEVLEKLKGKKLGVFCDGANIFYGSQKYGWHVNVDKLKRLIDSYGEVIFMNYYMAIPARNDAAFASSQRFVEKIKKYVNVKSKELKYIPAGGQVIKKGNMDVEMVLDVVRSINVLDMIIVVSGDSDFIELKNYVTTERGKKMMFIGYGGNMGWELRQCWHLYFEHIKPEIILE